MERISVFDVLKIGVGPSSSHTMGPWRAAQYFINDFTKLHSFEEISSLSIKLFGSLAKTGVGHGTDIAVMMGLLGEDPVTTDVETLHDKISLIRESKTINLLGEKIIPFDPAISIDFRKQESLPLHSNALTLSIILSDNSTFESTYYSVGGGFVVKDGEDNDSSSSINLDHPIDCAEDLDAYCEKHDLSISDVVRKNEQCWKTDEEIDAGLLNIWRTMASCIFRGCHTEGHLPGGLNVKRRAANLNKQLLPIRTYSDFDSWKSAIQDKHFSFEETIQWVSCFALAVNEENASYGRVVTAPTNGAAGVIPSVLQYYLTFTKGAKEEDAIRFLLTAGEIGSIFKKGATISAAMGGCQAEIGVSSAMAAAALTECLGGSPKHVLMAAEIAMEHHLGLTCDPIGGLVQIPCIERNSMGAIKAITASQIALNSDPESAIVSLDNVIKTMWETAQEMNSKFKETSDGGLAVNVPVNIPEC